jgi:hypothetical protein
VNWSWLRNVIISRVIWIRPCGNWGHSTLNNYMHSWPIAHPPTVNWLRRPHPPHKPDGSDRAIDDGRHGCSTGPLSDIGLKVPGLITGSHSRSAGSSRSVRSEQVPISIIAKRRQTTPDSELSPIHTPFDASSISQSDSASFASKTCPDHAVRRDSSLHHRGARRAPRPGCHTGTQELKATKDLKATKEVNATEELNATWER